MRRLWCSACGDIWIMPWWVPTGACQSCDAPAAQRFDLTGGAA